jgi:ubiquitin-protein ligase
MSYNSELLVNEFVNMYLYFQSSYINAILAQHIDIASLDAGRIAEATFPNPQDLTNFIVVVSPDEGFWTGARYEFTFSIPPTYPHDPPKVHCNTKIFHPNINLEGKWRRLLTFCRAA